MGDNTGNAGSILGAELPYTSTEQEEACEELQEVADEGINNVPDGFKSSKNFTVAGAKVLGQAKKKPSFSNLNTCLADNPELYEQFLEGTKPNERANGQPLCNGDTHQFSTPKMNVQKGGHSEARIISDLANSGTLQGQSLVINVNLVKTNQNGAIHKMPCYSCHRLLCDVMKSCNTSIYMCDYKNQFVNMQEYCDPNKLDKRGRSIPQNRGGLKEILQPKSAVSKSGSGL